MKRLEQLNKQVPLFKAALRNNQPDPFRMTIRKGLLVQLISTKQNTSNCVAYGTIRR
jgi:hypothetical protein